MPGKYTFEIKVNLKTLRKNPRWPSDRRSHELVGSHGTIRGTGKMPTESEMEAIGAKVFATTRSYGSYGVRLEWTLAVLDVDGPALEEFRKKYPTANVDNVQHVYRTVHSILPEPEYLYDYCQTKVRCRHCKSSFLHDRLESGETYDGETEFTWEDQCPRCDRNDACTVHYEDVGDALARQRTQKRRKSA